MGHDIQHGFCTKCKASHGDIATKMLKCSDEHGPNVIVITGPFTKYPVTKYQGGWLFEQPGYNAVPMNGVGKSGEAARTPKESAQSGQI